MEKNPSAEVSDLIIIGGGCAGYAAAMYAGRLQLKTILFADVPGGTIINTDVVENYPGFIKLTGQQLAEKFKEHALEYKDFCGIMAERVDRVEKSGKLFKVFVGNVAYKSKTIIFATGTKRRELGIPGEREFASKGVFSCALCDGPFMMSKTVGVIGGSDAAAKEALLLTQWAKKVYMIYRGDKIHPEPINLERVKEKMKKGKIEIISNTNVVKIKGNSNVNSISLDRYFRGKKTLKVEGVFVEIGANPKSELAKSIGVRLNKDNEIIIKDSKTNIKGVFAAGDVTDTPFKQAITGVGEAVIAAYSAYRYLGEEMVMPMTESRM